MNRLPFQDSTGRRYSQIKIKRSVLISVRINSLAQRVGEPNPYGFRFPCVVALNNTSRILLSHVAPLGLWCVWCMPPCYKHVAPLGLNARVHLSSDGLGNPTPTNSIPLGLNAAQFAVRHPS